MIALITLVLWFLSGWLAWRLWMARFVGEYPGNYSPKHYAQTYKFLYDHYGAEAVKAECQEHLQSLKREGLFYWAAGPVGLIVALLMGSHRSYKFVQAIEKEYD